MIEDWLREAIHEDQQVAEVQSFGQPQCPRAGLPVVHLDTTISTDDVRALEDDHWQR